jgi:hypothetical protein
LRNRSEKVILTLDDLEGHISGLKTSDQVYAPLRCLQAILAGMKGERSGPTGDLFTWTIDPDQPACRDDSSG